MRVAAGALLWAGGLTLVAACTGSPAPVKVSSTVAPGPSTAVPTVTVTSSTQATTNPTSENVPSIAVTAAPRHGRFIAMQFRCSYVSDSAQASWTKVQARITHVPNTAFRYDNGALSGAGALILTKALHGQVGSTTQVRVKAAQASASAVAVWATVVDPAANYDSGAVMADATNQLLSVMSSDQAVGSCSAGPSPLLLPPRLTSQPDDTR